MSFDDTDVSIIGRENQFLCERKVRSCSTTISVTIFLEFSWTKYRKSLRERTAGRSHSFFTILCDRSPTLGGFLSLAAVVYTRVQHVTRVFFLGVCLWWSRDDLGSQESGWTTWIDTSHWLSRGKAFIQTRRALWSLYLRCLTMSFFLLTLTCGRSKSFSKCEMTHVKYLKKSIFRVNNHCPRKIN